MVLLAYSKYDRVFSMEKDEKITGYCVKCRVKEGREMKDVEEVTMKNGRRAAKGKCTVCDTGMYRILPKAK